MTYRKEICYDRETRDYAMYLDGELVGFGRTYHEAEVTLDQLVFELMSGEFFKAPDGLVVPPVDELVLTATELDGGAVDMPSTCKNCKGPHHSWQCPQIGDLLFELGPCIGTPIAPSCGRPALHDVDHGLIFCEDCFAHMFAPQYRVPEPVVMDLDLGGPGGIDLYAAAFELDDQPDLIAEAGILINTLEEMQFDLCADYEAEGRFPPSVMAHHNRLCRILAKAERRLQRREFAELGGAGFTPPGVEYAPFGFAA